MNQTNPPRRSPKNRKRPIRLTKTLQTLARKGPKIASPLSLTCDDESMPPKIARVLGPYRNGDKWRVVVFDQHGRKALLAPTLDEAEKIQLGLLQMFEDRSLVTIAPPSKNGSSTRYKPASSR